MSQEESLCNENFNLKNQKKYWPGLRAVDFFIYFYSIIMQQE